MEAQGEPIPGSRYVRSFCLVCNEPIRVSQVGHNLCQDCGFGRVRRSTASVPDETSPGWDNAVRAWEDADA